jgi:16S rRNA (guanine(527)-N(7))-methyltransferase RsmG
LLLAWTEAINLTAIRDPADVALGHVIDSLAAVGWLRDQGVARLLDLGSGGGFPGVPIAAALPAVRVVLLEPIAKKARFLATSLDATGLAPRVTVNVARAEEVARDRHERGRWPAITARAVASLADLIELAFPLLVDGGSLVAWKRGDIDGRPRWRNDGCPRRPGRGPGGAPAGHRDADGADIRRLPSRSCRSQAATLVTSVVGASPAGDGSAARLSADAHRGPVGHP